MYTCKEFIFKLFSVYMLIPHVIGQYMTNTYHKMLFLEGATIMLVSNTTPVRYTVFKPDKNTIIEHYDNMVLLRNGIMGFNYQVEYLDIVEANSSFLRIVNIVHKVDPILN